MEGAVDPALQKAEVGFHFVATCTVLADELALAVVDRFVPSEGLGQVPVHGEFVRVDDRATVDILDHVLTEVRSGHVGRHFGTGTTAFLHQCNDRHLGLAFARIAGLATDVRFVNGHGTHELLHIG